MPLHDQLNALADGELPPEQSISLLRTLAADQPEALGKVADQQQLRLAVRQVMQTPLKAPAELARQIEQLTAAPPAQPAPSLTSPPPASPLRLTWLGRAERWTPLAAAVLIVAVAGVNLLRSGSSPQPAALQSTASRSLPMLADAGQTQSATTDLSHIIPKERLTQLARRHEHCAEKSNQLSSVVAFPQQLELVPAAVSEYLGGNPYPSLDFSMLGYQFDGIGRCRIPGSDSVHLVYRAMPQTGRASALSLWIQPDTGQLEIPANQLFSLPDEQYPMFVWRDGGMVYYLMGDSLRAMTGAQQMLIASR